MRSSIQVCEWYISSFHPEKLPLFDILALFFEVLPGDVSDLVGVPGWLRPLGSCLLFFFSKKNESYIDWQVQSFLGSPILTRYDISYLWRLSNCHAIHFSGKSEGVRKGTEDKYRWCNQWSFFRFCRETIYTQPRGGEYVGDSSHQNPCSPAAYCKAMRFFHALSAACIPVIVRWQHWSYLNMVAVRKVDAVPFRK